MNTPENITHLEPYQVFVFGSNTSGIHGAGAAKTAKLLFGAKTLVPEGRTGMCYAIPTRKMVRIRTSRRASFKDLSLEVISRSVDTFLLYAAFRKELQFLVTKIGCGYAGYTPEQIAPMFQKRTPNVILPLEFEEVLRGHLLPK